MRLTVAILSVLISSCQPEQAPIPEGKFTKLICRFEPSFSETSEIVFLDSNSEQRLNFLIRNDLFSRHKGEKEENDTFYFRSIALDSYRAGLIKISILDHWKADSLAKPSVLTDGISFNFTRILKQDTSEIHRQYVVGQDTSLFRVTRTMLVFCSKLYNDSILNGYFEDIRANLGMSADQDLMEPYRRLQQKTYEGRLRINSTL